MEIPKYALKDIFPNPYQTRENEDFEHIKSLAASIVTHTMLQIPSARPASGQMGKLELAFGHSRLAAYRLLTEAGTPGYETFPLNVVEMNDEQMFEAAVAENRDRKDLTPIEEAKAMLRYRDEFHKTSEEIGVLFHLSDSAVRNKIRLLELPEGVQKAVGVTITENAAREIVSVMDLPEDIETKWGSRTTKDLRKELIAQAADGASSEQLQEAVVSFFRESGEKMDEKRWKHEDDLVGEGIIGRCTGCAFLQKRKSEYCLKPECFRAKEKAWKLQYLTQASLLSGILVHERAGELGSYYSDTVTSFQYGSVQAKLKDLRKAQCENLRLVYDELRGKPGESDKITHLVKESFPAAMIVCMKRSGHCTCMKAIEKGIDVTKQGDGALAEKQLKELRRLAKEQTKIDRDAVKHLAAVTVERIVAGLNERNFNTWAVFLKKIPWKFDPEKVAEKTVEQLIEQAVELIVATEIEYTADDLRGARSLLNQTLKRCGLELFELPQEQPVVEEGEPELEEEAVEDPGLVALREASEMEAANAEK
jgi:ParB family chromosome partitioning protein